MRFNCKDCGQPLGQNERSRRPDVCDTCWDNRLRLVQAGSGISAADFATAQRKIAAGRGSAKAFIDGLFSKEATE